MGQKGFNPYTPSRRQYTIADFSEITKSRPEKSLLAKGGHTGGRNHNGHATDCNMGGGHKRRYRVIDFRRDKLNVPAKVEAIEYDPNRTVRIALLHYKDGEKRYILCPQGLEVGQIIVSADTADIKPGNCLPLKNIPIGQMVHNVELKVKGGGQLGRSAGCGVLLRAKEGDWAQLKLPSGEVRLVHIDCRGTVGVLGNTDHKNTKIGKAGRTRWLGRRPHNRGMTKNPVDHPMGGGQGKSKSGGGWHHPQSRTGVLAKGYKTRHNKRTDKFIVQRRTKKTTAE